MTQVLASKPMLNNITLTLSILPFGFRSCERKRVAASWGICQSRRILPRWNSDGLCTRLRAPFTGEGPLAWTKYGFHSTIFSAYSYNEFN